MKRCTFLLLLTTFLAAQSAPEVEITSEPHHHQVLVNDQVRAFYVDVAPHSETLMHWHRHDYIYITLGPSQVISAAKGKDPVSLKLNDGDTYFLPATFAHIARNLADTPFRNVTVELLQDEKLRHSTYHWDPAHPDEDRSLQILHGGTQEILWVKDSVRASEVELQMGATLPHEHAGPFLLVALTNCELQDNNAKAPTITLKTGDTRWFPANTKALTNAAHTPAKFVTLEFQ
jgi:quercetin dioxygenase-like cupin family protein